MRIEAQKAWPNPNPRPMLTLTPTLALALTPSPQFFLPTVDDSILERVDQRVQYLTRLPISHAEYIQVLDQPTPTPAPAPAPTPYPLPLPLPLS